MTKIQDSTAVTDERCEWTQAELMEEGFRRFGVDPLTWAFVCPNCGDEATLKDFQDATGDIGRAGQECIGRSLGALAKPKPVNSRGCDWVAYGLLRGPWSVEFPDGHKAWSFRFAEVPE